MLRATKNGDDRKFSRYADFVYGKPDESDVSYVVKHVQDLVEVNLGSEIGAKKDAAARLKSMFENLSTDIDEGVDKSVLPEGEVIEGKLSGVEEAVTVFEEGLVELGAEDWTVVVDSKKGITSFSANQEHKQIPVPSEEALATRAISRKEFMGIVKHELMHVERRVNGERSSLQLLGLGLDRYLRGEEGVTTYVEQLVTGAKDFAGIPRYLSIALAKGLGGKKRDFRQTYEIMKDYRLLTASEKDIAEEKFLTTAYNDCIRIFRGTSCSTPGAVYPKDMAYFGNRDIWTLVSKNSDVVHQFSIGKYDPNNSEHIALLTQLGILDEDLDYLEREESTGSAEAKVG